MAEFWLLHGALSTPGRPVHDYTAAVRLRLASFACLLLPAALSAEPPPEPALAAPLATPAETRTVYRCVRDGTVSLSTAPEPGSRCRGITYDANSPKVPDLWQTPGGQQGVLYERQQDGRTVYGTRALPGAMPVLDFVVPAPSDSPAHTGLGRLGPPRLDVFRDEFRRAARQSGVDEAWLRAVAHIESGYDAAAVSPKGAQGVMQLMPETAAAWQVTDVFDPAQSILGGARELRQLRDAYGGDLELVAAAYNAGAGNVARYGGVPPWAETRTYVANVLALHQAYREAMAPVPAAR
jgi:hypothetical protein